MSITERGEILSQLYKAAAECGVVIVRAQDCRAVSVAVAAQEARDILNEKINEMQGREIESRQINFSRSKF